MTKEGANKLLSFFAAIILTLILIIICTNAKIKSQNSFIKTLKKEISVFEEKLKSSAKALDEGKKEIEQLNNFLKEKENENIGLKSNIEDLKKKIEEENQLVSFNPYNLWEKSNVTESKMKKALKDTELESLSKSYVKAEKEWGVNAIFLAALTAEESAWGTSKRAREQNNLSGYGVYSPTSSGVNFSSKEESINETAKLISNDYLKEDGSYHKGISIWNVNESYSVGSDYDWSENIIKISNTLIKKINNQ